MSRARPSTSTRLRVLVAEGAPTSKNTATGLLERAGHAVVQARDSAAVARLATSESFDLIVLDIDLSGLDVAATTARIRGHERRFGGHVPLVVLTSENGRRARQASLAAGADVCVSRPLERGNFLEAVDQLLRAHPPAPRHSSSINPESSGALQDEDARLFRRLQAALIETTSVAIEKLRAAIAASEVVTVHRMAQGLKGALIIFKADQAAVRAAELEESGARGDLREARRLLPMLEAEMSSALAKARSELFEEVGELRPGSNSTVSSLPAPGRS